MTTMLRSAASWLAFFALGAFSVSAAPNIVLIMSDDQGYGDYGSTGNLVLDTPNLDRLARESATMTTFYVNSGCAPTRAALMTGRYNQRTRVVDTLKGRAMLEPTEITLAEFLQASGYATGIFGKWHLGDCHPMRPTDQGFDVSLVHRGGGLGQPSEPIENDRRYTKPLLFKNNEMIESEGYCTDVFFDAAIEFIRHNNRQKRPFFAYITPNAPHFPVHDIPDDLYQKYKARDLSPWTIPPDSDVDRLARIYAMIENVDTNVGRLLEELERQELGSDTIVIYMGDNGPNTRRFVGPLRGMKTEPYEGGIRTPFFMRWPNRLVAGTTSDRVAAHIDVLPTLLEAASISVPTELKLDGRSFLPLLEGRVVDWPDRALVLQAHRGNAPVPFHNMAVRNQRWKLLHATGSTTEFMPAGIPFELYDMQYDPGERRDRTQERPEVVARLKRLYEEWFLSVSTTRPNNFDPPRIVLGTSYEVRTVLTPQDKRSDNTWLLRFEGEMRYDIELHWKKPFDDDLNLQIRVGGGAYDVNLAARSSVARIDGVSIPAGDTALSTIVAAGRAREEPHHVILINTLYDSR